MINNDLVQLNPSRYSGYLASKTPQTMNGVSQDLQNLQNKKKNILKNAIQKNLPVEKPNAQSLAQGMVWRDVNGTANLGKIPKQAWIPVSQGDKMPADQYRSLRQPLVDYMAEARPLNNLTPIKKMNVPWHLPYND